MTELNNPPLVSIGLPVYNGERYLKAAAQSLLGQSYRNIELVICDNASEDATAQICADLAHSDSRVRYERLASNIGALPNHNRVLERSRGEYFMWSSHDDIWDQSYVEKCLHLLEATPDAVAAYSLTGLINESGDRLDVMKCDNDLQDNSAARRFAQLLDMNAMIEPVYGVISMQALREVGFMPMHPAADRIVFAGLALRGRIVRAPESLYFRRQHAQRSVRVYPKLRDRYTWVSPRTAPKKIRPHFEYLALMSGVVRRCNLPLRQKAQCFAMLARWSRWNWKEFVADCRA